jgi:hypothetical protein
MQSLVALKTAGYADPAISGPSVNMLTSTYWDKMVDGLLNNIAPAPYFSGPATGWAFQGQTWPEATYGDTLRTWVEPNTIWCLGLLGIMDQQANNGVRLNKERWIATNVLTGGAVNLYQRASNVWGNSDATDAILYFMLFDPAAPAATDPRPDLPKQFAAPQIGAVLARTDWTPTATWFQARCSWETINHESGDCGQFGLFRKGLWLTSEWSNYALDGMGYTSLYHNILSIQNDAPAALNPPWSTNSATGSQWNNGAMTAILVSRLALMTIGPMHSARRPISIIIRIGGPRPTARWT